MVRSLISLVLVASLVYCGATVPLGERTFFGHMARIFASEETQDLVDGVKETGKPVLDQLSRGVKVGYDEVTREPSDSGPDRPAPTP